MSWTHGFAVAALAVVMAVCPAVGSTVETGVAPGVSPGAAPGVTPGVNPGGPFEADEHTTLLAHFEENTRQADYAVGLSLFAGNGARLTEGYYGRGIDLRSYGLWPNFTETCDNYTPRSDGWGFHARGNVDPYQGTFECWFKPSDPRLPKQLFSSNFLGAELCYSVFVPERNRYNGFGLTLNMYGGRYMFPTVAGRMIEGKFAFRQIEGFGRNLDPEHWHHFAMTWTAGELVIYLDGRPFLSVNLAGEKGLVMVNNPVRYMNMSDMVIDELRISNVVRYDGDFEPRWRDGQRPDYAFTGNPAVERFPAQPLAPPVVEVVPGSATASGANEIEIGGYQLRFDPGTGRLVRMAVDEQVTGVGSGNGLLLYRGLEREPIRPVGMTTPRLFRGVHRFEQRFEGGIVAEHALEAHADGGLVWSVRLVNEGADEAWLTPMLSLSAPLDRVDELFDNVEPRRQIHLPRHRDEYSFALPFVAASGDGRFFGVGIDPHGDINDIISQWRPVAEGGIVRQGTRLALAPGESFGHVFHVVHGEGAFDTMDAVAAFHARFPDLYHLRDDVPIYSYMPTTQYEYSDPYFDMKRLGWAGNFWGHGPGHDKGDEFGNPDWWDNPDLYDRHEYNHYTRRIERLWMSVANLRQFITLFFQRAYDNWYPVRRYHTCPDVTPAYIVEKLWPGYVPNEDPLCFGQYYKPSYGWWIVNEYNTPIGAHFRETTRRFHRQTMGTSVGFINDMSHAGSLYRHNDEIAQRTAGRSFSRDLGTFIRKALGRRQRYQALEAFDDRGRMTFWSDGGAFSHTLCAFSAGIAIEGAGMYRDLTGPGQYIVPARNMLGEKPFSAMTHLNDDWIGYFNKPEEFTPETLRDFYRYSGRQLVLFGIKHGVTLDPSSYMFGRQYELETVPIMVESTVLGRKVVHGAKVAEPLWVRRSGNDLDTFLVVGNTQPTAQRTDIEVFGRYFEALPVFAAYYGGATEHRLMDDRSWVRGVNVEPRDVAAFKAVALVDTSGEATVVSRFSGDGLAMRLTLEMKLAAEAAVLLSEFAPLYEVARITVNGQAVRYRAEEPLMLPAGDVVVQLDYRSRMLNFDAHAWQQVDLIREGRTNVCLVADPGVTYMVDPKVGQSFELGFERGTARLFNDFLEQYDSEDGTLGTVAPAEFVTERASDDPRWALVFRSTADVDAPGVRIDLSDRRVYIEGPTQGDMRRAMVMFMRMVDRKYPHVGRFHPLRFRRQHYQNDGKVPFDKWVRRAQTRTFYENFEDPMFLAKPVLHERYEGLYADGNMDFAGQYQMRWSPYLFEPTYSDDFVYGFAGSGKSHTREELERRTRPASE